jgi:hypothetical protein
VELERRHGLLVGPAVDSWRGVGPTIDAVGRGALELRRPLAVAGSVSAASREALGSRWIVQGVVYVRHPLDAELPRSAVGARVDADTLIVVEPDAARLFVDTLAIAPLAPVRAPSRAWDPTEAYIVALLSCPDQILAAVRGRRGSVDPRCNLR